MTYISGSVMFFKTGGGLGSEGVSAKP